MIAPRLQFAAVYFCGRVYCFGGSTMIWADYFSVENQNWIKIRDLPHTIDASSACVFRDKIFINQQ